MTIFCTFALLSVSCASSHDNAKSVSIPGYNTHMEKSRGWSSEHTSLKPFTYPVPETRFLHAGVNVYKFKIKYGNTTCINTDLQEGVVNEELQDAIRIILGNLDNLCPFTTEHLTIFPYLNKWERVSDLRFMHGDAFLTPYPYVCTVYVESKSWKQNVFGDKTKNTDVYNSVNRGSKLRETVDTERAIKWGRWEDAEEISHTRVHVDRNVAKSATHDTSKSNYNRCSSARVGSDYDNRSVLGESMKTKNTENRHPEGQPPALEKRSEESMALKKKGFLESLKSTLFPPVLQQIFSGNGQPS
ncbi:membrane-anchored junction protein isoform X2 [Varanus komodoensis]|uniref:membrane-anchored junction protein isoform X2 n=2 Tax=Varanus komodoensis TaxID=61221 RepID=UPI001CF7BA67|nr:membrane-anchored junction protein isoform X2 [Varanus komodoensis]